MRLLGRKREQATLDNYRHSGKPEFIAVYGRRRVGKTFLIREFFRNDFCFYLTGKANATLKEQLHEFNEAVVEYSAVRRKKARDWHEAFRILRELVEASPAQGRKVVFLDEMPWLATDKSGFLSALERFWNSWGSARDDLLLIVCGSASSWMVDHLINDTGGLHNRVTGSIYLQPFSLGECEQYFQEAGIGMNRYQMIESYMVFGGIPYYMSLMQPHLGFTQNVDTLCFSAGGVLVASSQTSMRRCLSSLRTIYPWYGH
jgi:AAA+ ATPase superfamily predicted ATPase